MNQPFRCVAVLTFALALALPLPTSAQAQDTSGQRARELRSLVDKAVAQALANFAEHQLKPDQIAVTLVDLRELYAVYAG